MGYPLTPLQQRALQVAKRNLGQREATGRNDGPFVRMIQRWAAKGYAWMDGQPWCVAYATYCIHTAARELGITSRIPERASSSRLYRWFKGAGLLLETPVAGCVGMVKGGPTGHSHTFLVHEVQGDFVVGVDGNWRNAVGWSKRRVEDCDYGAIV
jgi:hypothetical protein